MSVECFIHDWFLEQLYNELFLFDSNSYIKEKLKPAIQTEQQLIYLCHLFAPFMGRLDQERARVGYELTTLLYELLEQVDKKQDQAQLVYMDPICDLL